MYYSLTAIRECSECPHNKNKHMDDESHALLSHLERDDYKCTGTCYCEEYNEERRSALSLPLSRSLIYLVSAVSTAVAAKKAKEYFTEECKERYSDDVCMHSKYKIDLTECDTISRSHKRGKDERFMKRFDCEGHCLRTSRMLLPELQKELAELDCPSLTRKTVVELDCAGLTNRQSIELARNEFMDSILSPYCKEKTAAEDFNERFKTRKKNWYKIGLCVGRDDETEQNPSVMCKVTYVYPNQLELF